jgi:hypothetical protein
LGGIALIEGYEPVSQTSGSGCPARRVNSLCALHYSAQRGAAEDLQKLRKEDFYYPEKEIVGKRSVFLIVSPSSEKGVVIADYPK